MQKKASLSRFFPTALVPSEPPSGVTSDSGILGTHGGSEGRVATPWVFCCLPMKNHIPSGWKAYIACPGSGPVHTNETQFFERKQNNSVLHIGNGIFGNSDSVRYISPCF